MALVTCATCQQPVSSHAAACPRCGSAASASALSTAESSDLTALPTLGGRIASRWLVRAIGAIGITGAVMVLMAAVPVVARSGGLMKVGALVAVLGSTAAGIDFYLRRKTTSDMLPVRRSELWGTVGLWAGILLLVIPASTYIDLQAGLFPQASPPSVTPTIDAVRFSFIRICLVYPMMMYCLRRLQWAAATRAMVTVGRRESYSEFVSRTSRTQKSTC
jgi:hypothetical protein